MEKVQKGSGACGQNESSRTVHREEEGQLCGSLAGQHKSHAGDKEGSLSASSDFASIHVLHKFISRYADGTTRH